MKNKKISITTYTVESLTIDAKRRFEKVIDQNDLMPESSDSSENDSIEETSTDPNTPVAESGDAELC